MICWCYIQPLKINPLFAMVILAVTYEVIDNNVHHAGGYLISKVCDTLPSPYTAHCEHLSWQLL